MDEIWYKKRKINEDDIEELIGMVKERKERTKSKVQSKLWWIEGYNNWDDRKFKKRFQVSRETFEYILNKRRHKTRHSEAANQLQSFFNNARTSTNCFLFHFKSSFPSQDI